MMIYHHEIPASRLGRRHESLASYTDAVKAGDKRKEGRNQADVPTEFSLVVLLSRNAHNDDNDCSYTNNDARSARKISILLGKKLRGFGEGFYNCFGGKLERSRGEHTNPAKGAVRELEEETGIAAPLSVMEDGFVGTINFTFEDCDVNGSMKVHLYCIFILSLSKDAKCESEHDGERGQPKQQAQSHITIDPKQIRGCDEIEPRWFHDINNIPLDQMFADDSLWLTMLLSHYNTGGEDLPPKKLMFDAWFHFHPGGAKTNSIMHHFIQINSGGITTATANKSPQKITLERRIFHALHINHIHSPSIKEFKENWAMANSVRTFLKDEGRMEYVLDVAGGHGALGALFLLLVPKCRGAVVIDPAKCISGKKGVREAWSRFWSDDRTDNRGSSEKKELRYRHECLRTGLRKELDSILQHTKSTSVTVVACHACQHLTDETLQIASEYGVNVAVMPCCQKDHDGWWKGLTNRLAKSNGKTATLSIGAIMDLLAAGKMMGFESGSKAGVRYQVKMKLMNESISVQNRMILCKAVARDDDVGNERMDRKKEMAHEKLTRAYHRAHQLVGEDNPVEDSPEVLPQKLAPNKDVNNDASRWCIPSLLAGFCLGTAFSLITPKVIRK